VGVVDEYEFDNPSTYDGSEVYSQVIGKYTDAAGVASNVAVNAPTSATYAPVAGVIANPTFDVDLSGWTILALTGTIVRTTAGAEVHSGAGAMKITDGGTGDTANAGIPLANLEVGRRYQVSYWSLVPVGAGNDYFPCVRSVYGGYDYHFDALCVGGVTNNGIYTNHTMAFTATATRAYLYPH